MYIYAREEEFIGEHIDYLCEKTKMSVNSIVGFLVRFKLSTRKRYLSVLKRDMLVCTISRLIPAWKRKMDKIIQWLVDCGVLVQVNESEYEVVGNQKQIEYIQERSDKSRNAAHAKHTKYYTSPHVFVNQDSHNLTNIPCDAEVPASMGQHGGQGVAQGGGLVHNSMINNNKLMPTEYNKIQYNNTHIIELDHTEKVNVISNFADLEKRVCDGVSVNVGESREENVIISNTYTNVGEGHTESNVAFLTKATSDNKYVVNITDNLHEKDITLEVEECLNLYRLYYLKAFGCQIFIQEKDKNRLKTAILSRGI